jgi:catechol 2,3-dioxygenase-like lactoylglutathione lyase family enzyme
MANYLVENTIAVLAVADVPASIRFYREALGFELDWTGDGGVPQIASVSRNGHAIMIRRSDAPHPGCVWIGVSELVSLWEKIRSGGDIAVVERPTNQSWALEMQIEDLDGNVLWFGMEPLAGIPFGTEVEDCELPRLPAGQAAT